LSVCVDNIKKTKRASRHTGVNNADQSGKTPRLLRLMTPTTLSQFTAENGLVIDMSTFMRVRSNLSPTRARSSFNLEGMKTFPSSNEITMDMNSSKMMSSSKTSKFLSIFSARRSESTSSMASPTSRRGYFWASGKANVGKDKERDVSPRTQSNVDYPASRQMRDNLQHQDSFATDQGIEAPREPERPISMIPEEGISSRSLGSAPQVQSIAPQFVSRSRSTCSINSGANGYTAVAVAVNATVVPSPPNSNSNSGNSSGSGSPNGPLVNEESPKSPRSDKSFSRHNSNHSQMKSSTSSVHVYQINNVSKGSHSLSNSAASGEVERDGVDYGVLLQGLNLDDMLSLDKVYSGPFAQALRRTLTGAAMGGDFRDFSNEFPDSDDEDDMDLGTGAYVLNANISSQNDIEAGRSSKFRGRRLDVSEGFDEVSLAEESPKGSIGEVSRSGSYRGTSSKSNESPTADGSILGRISSGIGVFGRLLSGGTSKPPKGFGRDVPTGSNKNAGKANGMPLNSKVFEHLDNIEEEGGSPSPDVSAHRDPLSKPVLVEEAGLSPLLVASDGPAAQVQQVQAVSPLKMPPVSEVSKRGSEAFGATKSSPNNSSPNRTPSTTPDKGAVTADCKSAATWTLPDDKCENDMDKVATGNVSGGTTANCLAKGNKPLLSPLPEKYHFQNLQIDNEFDETPRLNSRDSVDQPSLNALAVEKLTAASAENVVVLEALDIPRLSQRVAPNSLLTQHDLSRSSDQFEGSNAIMRFEAPEETQRYDSGHSSKDNISV
jgi:hypothetical protein